jgi:hypothetical protein
MSNQGWTDHGFYITPSGMRVRTSRSRTPEKEIEENPATSDNSDSSFREETPVVCDSQTVTNHSSYMTMIYLILLTAQCYLLVRLAMIIQKMQTEHNINIKLSIEQKPDINHMLLSE